jgi:YD repeat-containing protein
LQRAIFSATGEENIIAEQTTYADLMFNLPDGQGEIYLLNRPRTIKDANGNVTTYSNFNGQGLPETVTAPAAAAGTAIEVITYDNYGRITSTTNGENIVSQNIYDTEGNLVKTIADVNGEALKTVFFYDQIGNVCRTVGPRHPDIGTLTGGYDSSCDTGGEAVPGGASTGGTSGGGTSGGGGGGGGSEDPTNQQQN